jgi:hypothetical protein
VPAKTTDNRLPKGGPLGDAAPPTLVALRSARGAGTLPGLR